jgi:hypothetical protein
MAEGEFGEGNAEENGNRSGLGGHAALEGEEDQVSAAADTEFVEQVGDVELYGALSDVELAGDFFVGKILEEGVEDFLFAAAQIGHGIGFEAARLAGEDGIHEAGKNGARNPEAAGGDEREGADQLVAGFSVGEDAFYTQPQQREASGVLVLFPHDDEPSVGMSLENVGEERACGLTSGVGINDVDLSFRRFEGTKIGSEGGLELFGDDFEVGLG